MKASSLARALVAAAALCAASAIAAPAPRWTIVDLGELGTTGAVARGVNDRGDIVGYSFVPPKAGEPSGGNHAFLWQDGLMTDLGLAPGTDPRSPNSFAVDVNDRGTVLAGDWMNDAWTWSDGIWTPLHNHDPADINKSGAVIGHYAYGRGTRSYLYNEGVVTDLGSLGGDFTIAFAINDKSIVAGQAHFPEGNAHAFVWDGTIHDIGTLGGAASYAADINNRGVVVGRSLDAAGRTLPFIWDERSGMRALFDSSGFTTAYRINDHGVVLGTIDNRAYMWDGGVVTMLDDIPEVRAAGWSNLLPQDINNRGWIVGSGTRAGSFFSRAFALIPR